MDEKIKDIIDHLLALTKSGKLEWQYANSENSFKLELDSATLVVSYVDADLFSGNESVYCLEMYNGTGKPIELVSLAFSDDRDERQQLSSLYYAARESTDKKQATINKILEELTLKDLIL